MHVDRPEPKWIEALAETLSLAHVQPGEIVAIASETQSRRVLVEVAEQALVRLGARPYHVVALSPRAPGAIPLRSTGTSLAFGDLGPAVEGLANAALIVDCTVEGLLHTPERATLLSRGARIFMLSDEHPEVFDRLRPMPGLQELCERGGQLITGARKMRVTSRAGSDLDIDLGRVAGRGSAGVADKPGRMGYWPAGMCICNPGPGSVNGRLVLSPGDANLTFKRYIETPVTLVIEDDYVTRIEGSGLDAELMRSYYAAWNDREAYAVAHVGWGMNPAARWDALTMYDRRDVNGTELRAFAGNFLYSTGANEAAGRFTACHFDIPMRNCTVALDGEAVVANGVLRDDLSL